MVKPANTIGGAIAAVGGAILLVIAIPAGWVDQPALAAPPTSARLSLTAPAPAVAHVTSIAGGGVRLDSVSLNLPTSEGTFAGGAEARAINSNCLICHSAGMVLTQANLSRAEWQAEVEKMRNAYKAPIGAEAVPAIVDYLAQLSNSSKPMMAGHEPDADHGAVIVAQGTAKGAPACALCHAFNGVSDGSGAFPRLAGQSDYYLAKELGNYASGSRLNAIMSPIAKALSPDEVADVSAYYSQIDAPFPQLKAPDPALVRRGKELAKLGDATKRIQSCDNCHGTGGVGAPPAIPYLGGQYAHYIIFTLNMWQQGYRKTSPDDMEVTAHKLDEHEIAAVGAYYQQAPSQPRIQAAESQAGH